MKIEGLAELLQNLRDEVNQWDLDGGAATGGGEADAAPAEPQNDPAQTDLIRRGLYLTAMDILLAEMRRPGGYESYAVLPDRIILPESDYQPLRRALDPYVTWFRNLLFQHATHLAQTGVSEHDAFTQAVLSGTETLTRLSSV